MRKLTILTWFLVGLVGCDLEEARCQATCAHTLQVEFSAEDLVQAAEIRIQIGTQTASCGYGAENRTCDNVSGSWVDDSHLAFTFPYEPDQTAPALITLQILDAAGTAIKEATLSPVYVDGAAGCNEICQDGQVIAVFREID